MSDVRSELLGAYVRTRRRTEQLAAPLSPEDQTLQSMPSASPAKWHRAHTTWFFETFVLATAQPGVPPYRAAWGVLFNSYYEAVGPRHARPKRGMLSRPSAQEVGAYRAAVDDRMMQLLEGATESALADLAPIVRLGVAHEEQHQELLLTDVLHAFSESPLRPAYRGDASVRGSSAAEPLPMGFVPFEGGLCSIGARDDEPFAFDNEGPRHKRWIEPFALANRLVTVREVKAFIRDGGYQAPSLWLSEGWDFVRAHALHAPLHAHLEGDAWIAFGLDGQRQAHDDEPACHLSFYEADAIARWLGARLPTEAEWEVAAGLAQPVVEGNFLDSGALRPLAGPGSSAGAAGATGATGATKPRPVHQLYGDTWEWTRSSYDPYPGFSPPQGAIGEYNGKFMVSQLVLRGGSCLTPAGHVRPSYRNFWPPDTRFQMTGARLAKDR
jgi:ergothioneine biosynthesis protein EgtB